MIHPEFPFIAFFSAALVLVPLPWHWRAGNVATLSIIAWLFVVNVIYGVDAIIWGDSLVPTLAIWCDISTSYRYLFHVGRPVLTVICQLRKSLSARTWPYQQLVCASVYT